MASVNDWAAKAAKHIVATSRTRGPARETYVAAVIATFAEPLINLLREAKRQHYHCDDSWYCCGKCSCNCRWMSAPDHEHDEACYPESHAGEAARLNGICNCGADEWNAKIDAALRGKP